MKSTEVQDAMVEVAELESKKRLGSKQKLRLNHLRMVVAQHPWVSPRNPQRTGARAPFDYDHDGSKWRIRLNPKPVGEREARRAARFGRNGIKPFRSRIQRQTRKRRTGGVK